MRKSVFLAGTKRDLARMIAGWEAAEMTSRKAEASEAEIAAEAEKIVSLNFKISPDFKKEFKGFAVAQGISMTDLLKEGFALSKKHREN